MTEFVRTSLLIAAAYLVAGLLFTFAFHRRGLRAIDAAAHGTGIAFRLLITPGIIALWPLVALRWRRTLQGGSFLGDPERPVSPRRLRSIHRLAWKALMVLVPVAVAAALWYRPGESSDPPFKPAAPVQNGGPAPTAPH